MYRKLVLYLLDNKLFNQFVQYILPKIFWRKPKFPDKQMVEQIHSRMINVFQLRFRAPENYKGIIISSRDPSKVTGLLIPTDIDHSAVIVGYFTELRDFGVIEAVASGVRLVSLRDFIRTSEAVTCHVGEGWDNYYRRMVTITALLFRGKPYDRKFKFGAESLYCSEISYECDVEKRCKYNLDDFAGIGREYISPKGITEAVGMVKIFDSEIE